MRSRVHRFIRVVIAAIIGPVLSGGCAREAPQAAPPRAVRVVEVQPRDARGASRYTGSIMPRVQLDLAFRVGGRVAKVARPDGKGPRPLQEGDFVTRGQLLAWLDPGDLKLQAGAAAAGVSSAAAQVEAAAASLAQAESEVKRARLLFSTGSIPRAELDRAEAAYGAATANHAAAKGQQRVRAEQYALAASTVSDSRLKSPIDGIIGRRMLEEGETVSPGKPVFTLIDTSEMRVVFGVPDLLVNSLEVGRQVPVSIDALPGMTVVGTVSKISPVADPALRSYSVEVSVPNPTGSLKAGMVASVGLERDPRRSSLLVPLPAVVRGSGGRGYAVFVLDGGGVVSPRTVALGDLYDNDVVVEDGLHAGDRVVTEGAQFLRAGEKVEAMP
jgi:RND family efflux transporter MFP subunit